MVRKLTISLIFLMSGISLFGQGNFMFNQHGNQDCQYGNLAEYTTKLQMVVQYQSTSCGIPLTNINSLISAKQALDNIRSCELVEAYGSNIVYCITATIGSVVLAYQIVEGQIVPACELFPIADFWGFEGYPNFSVGTTPIFHIVNGIITYIEYY